MWIKQPHMESAAVGRSTWQEQTGFIGRKNRKHAVRLDSPHSPNVGRGRGRECRKEERWKVRKKGIKNNLMVGHFSTQPLLYLPSHFSASQPLLHLLLLPPRPSLNVRFPQSSSQLSFLTALLTLTSLVSMTSSVLTCLKFILSVLDHSSRPQTPDIST